MPPETVLHKLLKLENKIRRLSEIYRALEARNLKLVEENNLLKEEVVLKKEELKNFQNQHKIDKIVSVLGNDVQRSSELKLTIGEYIKEIDKCLAYFNEE